MYFKQWNDRSDTDASIPSPFGRETEDFVEICQSFKVHSSNWNAVLDSEAFVQRSRTANLIKLLEKEANEWEREREREKEQEEESMSVLVIE